MNQCQHQWCELPIPRIGAFVVAICPLCLEIRRITDQQRAADPELSVMRLPIQTPDLPGRAA